jgi:F0F1-type ATP synthase membrane subunit b/b'
LKDFNWIVGFVFPYINFFIFVFLFLKLFKKPIVDAMANRKTVYEQMAAEATRAKEEAEAKSKELDTKIATLTSQIEDIKGKAIAQAKKEADHLTDEAKKLAKHLTSEAKRVASAEIAAAKVELEKQLLESAKSAVVTKLSAELSQEKQQSLIEKGISNLNGGVK